MILVLFSLEGCFCFVFCYFVCFIGFLLVFDVCLFCFYIFLIIFTFYCSFIVILHIDYFCNILLCFILSFVLPWYNKRNAKSFHMKITICALTFDVLGKNNVLQRKINVTVFFVWFPFKTFRTVLCTWNKYRVLPFRKNSDPNEYNYWNEPTNTQNDTIIQSGITFSPRIHVHR